jgi:hypothetical protein
MLHYCIRLTISSSVSASCMVRCRFVDSVLTIVRTPFGGLEFNIVSVDMRP